MDYSKNDFYSDLFPVDQSLPLLVGDPDSFFEKSCYPNSSGHVDAGLGVWPGTHCGLPVTACFTSKVVIFANGEMEVSAVRIDAMDRMRNMAYDFAGRPVRQSSTVDEQELTPEMIQAKADESKARSIRRARQNIRYKLKQLDADHMITLNYRENMMDFEQLKADWQRFTRSVHAKYPAWQYVAVVEQQERGSLHLHVGVHGRQDIKYLRRCWYKALGASVDCVGVDTPGALNVTGPKKGWAGGAGGFKWASGKLSGYMCKYLSKAFDITAKSSKRFWASKDIASPVVYKFFLDADNVVSAVRETFDLFAGRCCRVVDMFLSEGWGCIWMSGVLVPDPA